MYICHLFWISSASVRSIPFLSLIVTIFAWNIHLVSLIFLRRSLVLPIPWFSFISLHWPLRKAFFSLLAIIWNSSFMWIYLPFLLLFSLLLFSQKKRREYHEECQIAWSHTRVKIVRRNINNLRYEDETIYTMPEIVEELKRLLMWVKGKSEKNWFKVQHSKN